MPITEERMSLEELRRHESPKYICAQCGGNMTVTWGGAFGYKCHILRCGTNWQHEGLVRPASLSPSNTPGFPGWKLSKQRRRQLAEELGPERKHQLMKYEGVAKLTKVEAREIVLTIWPDAPPAEVTKAILICTQYNLNPLMKHLYILGPFTDHQTGEQSWAVATGIQANRILAFRQGRYSYMDDTPRLMSDAEQTKIFGKVDKDKIWAITKLCDQQGNTAQGYGFWGKGKKVKGEDKGNSAENMAFIHSERQALDRLFPDALPANVEVVDERYVTGRIIESEVIPPAPTGATIMETKQHKRATKGMIVEEKIPTSRTAVNSPEGDETGEGSTTNMETGEPPGTTSAETEHVSEQQGKISSEKVAPGGKLYIDQDWLKEFLPKAKWSEPTAISWLKQFKVDTNGTLAEVLTRCSHEVQDKFVKEVQDRASMA